MSGMNIHELLGYGPIVFSSEEVGVVITINGSYLNWWHESSNGWHNSDCRSGHPDLYTLSVSDAMDLAERWFNEVMNGTDDEEQDEEDDEPEEATE